MIGPELGRRRRDSRDACAIGRQQRPSYGRGPIIHSLVAGQRHRRLGAGDRRGDRRAGAAPGLSPDRRRTGGAVRDGPPRSVMVGRSTFPLRTAGTARSGVLRREYRRAPVGSIASCAIDACAGPVEPPTSAAILLGSSRRSALAGAGGRLHGAQLPIEVRRRLARVPHAELHAAVLCLLGELHRRREQDRPPKRNLDRELLR